MKLKYIKCLALCAALALSLTVSGFASAVPENLVVENLNGQQRITKTYVLPPDTDPEILKEPSFDYDGFTYTWAFTTKEEHTFLETKTAAQTVTVETAKKDLNTIEWERAILPSPTLLLIYSPAIWKNWAGVSTVTLSSLALVSLLPAFSPQTK